MFMASVTVMIVALLLFGLLCLLAAFINSLCIVVEDGSDDGNHVSLNNSGADVFRASDADIDNTLKSKVPLPHSHHVLTTTLLENANETLDASINGKDITDASRGCGEIGEMIEGVDEGEGRGAVESTAVI
jgi:hypothetical protein